MSQTVNYSKTLRKTPDKAVVFLLITVNNQKISPRDTRGICAQRDLSTLHSYVFYSVLRKHYRVVKMVLQEALEIHGRL